MKCRFLAISVSFWFLAVVWLRVRFRILVWYFGFGLAFVVVLDISYLFLCCFPFASALPILLFLLGRYFAVLHSNPPWRQMFVTAFLVSFSLPGYPSPQRIHSSAAARVKERATGWVNRGLFLK